MHRIIVAASLLAIAASSALAQSAAPAAAPAPSVAASSPAKHKLLHAPKLRKGASAATNPEANPDKKGGA